MNEYPSIFLTFAAGFLSFLSPCVLPLIPSYLSILGSAAGIQVSLTEEDQANSIFANKKRFILLLTSICFILGFTIVFIIFSIIISATFLLMGGISKYIRIAAGIIVIILGFNILFDFLSILNYEKRINLKNKPRGLIGAFFAGAAFAAGWTPCIGPILTGVLFLAGQSGKAGIAAVYLAIYSLGLGIPFVLAALFFDRYLVSAKWFRDKMQLIKKISACILIIIGILILTGHFSALNTAMQRWQYQFIFWAQDKNHFLKIIANWLKMINI
ncbi:MAG: cytochrome c biogenesis protein CcdA [Treponema sp.]|nr:cytochrome c biogenesis protein CcdA [Treponema sp.]MCL2251248.1 cytochrome c biogenesis protein CcdA [Treponema sp.]